MLCATLRHFLEKVENCPNVIVSTHLHALLKFDIFNQNPNFQKCKMECILDSSKEQGNEMENTQLVFLYRLVEGISTESFALNCAKIANVPECVITRASVIHGYLESNQEVKPVLDQRQVLQEQGYQELVDTFLELDFAKGDMDAFMNILRASI